MAGLYHLVITTTAALLVAATPVLACLDHQPGHPPPDQDAAYAEVKEARRTGRLDDTIRLLQAYVATRPGHYQATYDLALAHLTKGNDARAEELLDIALVIREKENLCEATIFATSGNHHLKRGNHARAEGFFDLGLRGHTFATMDTNTRRRLLAGAAITKAHLGKSCLALQLVRISEALPGGSAIRSEVSRILSENGVADSHKRACLEGN